jgi:hypothetical protein
LLLLLLSAASQVSSKKNVAIPAAAAVQDECILNVIHSIHHSLKATGASKWIK